MRRWLWIGLGVAATALVVGALTRLDSEAFAEFLAQVQEAAAEREVELRASLGLDGRHDVVDVYTVGENQ